MTVGPVSTHPLASTGPLAAAVAPLVDASALTRPELRSAGADPLPDPAALLARMFELRGSIDLARLLAAPIPPPAAAKPEKIAALRALADERVAEARFAIDRLVVDPFARRHKLPNAEQVFTTLDEGGALDDRAGRRVQNAIDAIWAAYAELTTLTIDRARAEMKALRDELAPELRALGPAMARLERLDATLAEAIAKRRGEILAGALLPSLAKSFARSFRAALEALPSPATKEHVTLWFSNNGWLRRELSRAHAVVLAVLAHERARVEALLRAAAEPPEAPGA